MFIQSFDFRKYFLIYKLLQGKIFVLPPFKWRSFRSH